jgi:hypothetical protein
VIPIGSLPADLNPLSWVSADANSFVGSGLSLVVAWIQAGARAAVEEVAHVIGVTTTPQLTSTWFSVTYWRVAGLATILTVPFLFAAALQAVFRSDLSMLARAVFGYLPLALIGVGIATPITTLLLAATDEMCQIVSGLAVGGASHFLTQAAEALVLSGGSPFISLFVALIATGAALALALEMTVRAAAVYIVVLMLPMAFAALVWPARRVLAARLVELLVALILSKFVIVAVLSLAGAAYGPSGDDGVTRVLTAVSLLLLSTLAPWTMLRLLPFTELAASAAGALRHEVPQLRGQLTSSYSRAMSGFQLPQGEPDPADPETAAVGLITSRMRSAAVKAFDPGRGGDSQTGSSAAGRGEPPPAPEAGAGGADPVSDQPDPGAAAPTARVRGERLPGMDPIWQAGNGDWPPLNLGPGPWGGPTEYIPPGEAPGGTEYLPPGEAPGASSSDGSGPPAEGPEGSASNGSGPRAEAPDSSSSNGTGPTGE